MATVNGRVSDALTNTPLPNYIVNATTQFTVSTREDNHIKRTEMTVYLGQTTTNANGEFAIAYDWEQIKGRNEGTISAHRVLVTVIDPVTNTRAYKSPASLPGTFFDIKISLVSVTDWQLYYPASASSYALGDNAVLVAFVINRAGRAISNFGLHARMTPLSLEDDLANRYKDRTGPLECEVGLTVTLEAANTAQTGSTRFEPNPLSAKPMALAFQIPRSVTVIDPDIPTEGHQYPFEPSGTFNIDVALKVEGREVAWKSFTDVQVARERYMAPAARAA